MCYLIINITTYEAFLFFHNASGDKNMKEHIKGDLLYEQQ
jgi:hypothetical protein